MNEYSKNYKSSEINIHKVNTSIVMKEYAPMKKKSYSRFYQYNHRIEHLHDSPIIPTLDICVEFGVSDKVAEMIKGNIPSKTKYRDLIWKKTWTWKKTNGVQRSTERVRPGKKIIGGSNYSIWLDLSELDRSYMKRCKVMIKLISHISKLKDDDNTLKKGNCTQ